MAETANEVLVAFRGNDADLEAVGNKAEAKTKALVDRMNSQMQAMDQRRTAQTGGGNFGFGGAGGGFGSRGAAAGGSFAPFYAGAAAANEESHALNLLTGHGLKTRLAMHLLGEATGQTGGVMLRAGHSVMQMGLVAGGAIAALLLMKSTMDANKKTLNELREELEAVGKMQERGNMFLGSGPRFRVNDEGPGARGMEEAKAFFEDAEKVGRSAREKAPGWWSRQLNPGSIKIGQEVDRWKAARADEIEQAKKALEVYNDQAITRSKLVTMAWSEFQLEMSLTAEQKNREDGLNQQIALAEKKVRIYEDEMAIERQAGRRDGPTYQQAEKDFREASLKTKELKDARKAAQEELQKQQTEAYKAVDPTTTELRAKLHDQEMDYEAKVKAAQKSGLIGENRNDDSIVQREIRTKMARDNANAVDKIRREADLKEYDYIQSAAAKTLTLHGETYAAERKELETWIHDRDAILNRTDAEKNADARTAFEKSIDITRREGLEQTTFQGEMKAKLLTANNRAFAAERAQLDNDLDALREKHKNHQDRLAEIEEYGRAKRIDINRREAEEKRKVMAGYAIEEAEQGIGGDVRTRAARAHEDYIDRYNKAMTEGKTDEAEAATKVYDAKMVKMLRDAERELQKDNKPEFTGVSGFWQKFATGLYQTPEQKEHVQALRDLITAIKEWKVANNVGYGT